MVIVKSIALSTVHNSSTLTSIKSSYINMIDIAFHQHTSQLAE